jgi:hypothetical protein
MVLYLGQAVESISTGERKMLQVKETYVNETKGYQFGDVPWYEPYTDNIGKLFRTMQKE